MITATVTSAMHTTLVCAIAININSSYVTCTCDYISIVRATFDKTGAGCEPEPIYSSNRSIFQVTNRHVDMYTQTSTMDKGVVMQT